MSTIPEPQTVTLEVTLGPEGSLPGIKAFPYPAEVPSERRILSAVKREDLKKALAILTKIGGTRLVCELLGKIIKAMAE